MPSTALTIWKNDRQLRLDELVAVHRTVGGTGPGRRWQTRELNWALTLRLAGEFQGFARDLHDCAADYLSDTAAAGNADLARILRQLATADRGLDRGNAQPGSLGKDFARLGLPLWPTIYSADRRGSTWNTNLEKLNQARNAIAHVNDTQIQSFHVTLTLFRAWRRDLDLLATCMDDVVSTYLDSLLQQGRPW